MIPERRVLLCTLPGEIPQLRQPSHLIVETRQQLCQLLGRIPLQIQYPQPRLLLYTEATLLLPLAMLEICRPAAMGQGLEEIHLPVAMVLLTAALTAADRRRAMEVVDSLGVLIQVDTDKSR